MTFVTDGPFGDRVMFTGLPGAYRRATGARLRVASRTPEGRRFDWLYADDPDCELVDGPPPGDPVVYARLPADYPPGVWAGTYRPVLAFRELTGRVAPAAAVRATIRIPHRPAAGRVVVCDEAGWENRRGYPHLDALVERFNRRGCQTVHLRNVGLGPRQVRSARHRATLLDPRQACHFLATAAFFVGYESGMANAAGALGVPYAVLCGSSPAAPARHPSCVYALDACDRKCLDRNCPVACLAAAPDVNDDILAAYGGTPPCPTAC